MPRGSRAIEELARKITALHAITDLTKGTTVNVGLDLRRADRQHRRALGEMRDRPALRHAGRTARTRWRKITRIVETANVPGTSATLEIAGEFKPLVQAPRQQAAVRPLRRPAPSDLDIKVEGEFTGGCADSGFTAGVGTPTICAVGPVGGKAHTPDEYLVVDSLVPRAQILALAVARLR